MRTGNRRLKDLVRECVENEEAMPQTQIALLSMQDIVDIIILTIATLNGGEVYIGECQKEKGIPLHQRHLSPRKLRHS